MEKYNLLCPVERKGTNSQKWDGLKEKFGEDELIAMWVADMDFKAPDCVLSALEHYVAKGVFGYESIPQAYYDSLIAWEKERHHVEVEQDWLRFSPGVVAGFFWLVQMFTNPGDGVMVLSPVYYPFYNAISVNGRKQVACELVNNKGIYTVDFDRFEADLVANQVKMFILCSPHNPVGRVWTKEELSRMAALCKKHDVFLLSDEIHQDIIMPSYEHISMLRIAAGYPKLAVLTAGSKTFNLAGLNSSVVVLPNKEIRKAFDRFTNEIHVTKGNNFSYVALTAAFAEGRPWLEQVIGLIQENYETMKAAILEMMPKAVVSPLEGTYLMWVDLAAYIPAEEMKDFVQGGCRMAVDYGDWFGGTGTETCIRINLATPKQYIEKAIQNMKDAFAKR